MEPKNYAYYAVETGLVENIIFVSEDVAPTLTWPDSYSIVAIPDGLCGEHGMCQVGWSYINGQFVEPPLPPAPEQPIIDGAETL